jgi:hypothetical protein
MNREIFELQHDMKSDFSIFFFMNLLQFAARLLPEGKKQPAEE